MKLFLLSSIDREDYWIQGFAFEVSDKFECYKDHFEEIKDKLSSLEFQEKLAKEFCFDLSKNNLLSVEWNYAAIFTFQCAEDNEDYEDIGDKRTITLQADYIHLVR